MEVHGLSGCSLATWLMCVGKSLPPYSSPFGLRIVIAIVYSQPDGTFFFWNKFFQRRVVTLLPIYVRCRMNTQLL